MALQFESLSAEKAFDHAASEWIVRYRYPGVAPTALVLQRAYDNLTASNLAPSVSAFERAYRELLFEKQVPLALTPLEVPPESVKEPELTAEIYKSLPASVISHKMQTQKGFRDRIEALAKAGKI